MAVNAIMLSRKMTDLCIINLLSSCNALMMSWYLEVLLSVPVQGFVLLVLFRSDMSKIVMDMTEFE